MRDRQRRCPEGGFAAKAIFRLRVEKNKPEGDGSTARNGRRARLVVAQPAGTMSWDITHLEELHHPEATLACVLVRGRRCRRGSAFESLGFCLRVATGHFWSDMTASKKTLGASATRAPLAHVSADRRVHARATLGGAKHRVVSSRCAKEAFDRGENSRLHRLHDRRGRPGDGKQPGALRGARGDERARFRGASRRCIRAQYAERRRARHALGAPRGRGPELWAG